MKNLLLIFAATFMLASPAHGNARDWKASVSESLPLMGHRNWIVVADSAYPWQVSPGIETVETGASQLEVTQFVLEALAKSNHVKPKVYLDRELDFLTEIAAPGIKDYRKELGRILSSRPPEKLTHEKIIAKLDQAGKTFHILLLKTNMTLPYTSVYFQLECGYWSPKLEKDLRRLMEERGALR